MPNTIVDGNVFECSIFGPPDTAGVYLISVFNPRNKTKKIMYIGSSKNIRHRVMNRKHPYYLLLEKYPNLCVATEYCETEDYLALEIKAIKKLNPYLNVTHNGKQIFRN